MRKALDQALGAPSPGYSAGLVQGQPIKAIHIQELRDRVLAAWGSGSTTEINWLVADHLGTPRMVIDQTGALANVKRHDYLPFGEELFAGQGGRTIALGYSGDAIRQKFTSKERDHETGLDYFLARYYASTQGRFTGADPYDINFERQETADPEEADALFTKYIGQPQHWNRYPYALNNPLRYVDPDGRKDEEHIVVLLDNQGFKITISDKLSKKERETILTNILAVIDKINVGASKLTTGQKTAIDSMKGIKVTNDIPYSHMDPDDKVFKILPHRVITSTLEGLTADTIHDSFHADQKRRGKKYGGLEGTGSKRFCSWRFRRSRRDGYGR